MAIVATNLTRRFGGLTAVDGLTLSVPPGELFGLVGSDGAGKTTTIRMLTGVMDPTSGDARVLGCPCRDLEPVRNDIGYMSQRFGLYPDLTVAENIRFYADIFGVARRERLERTEHLLAFSNLAPFRDRKAANLSGGMKQKLGLACALIHTPKVLFLDEPTNGVDPVSRRDFWRILYGLLQDGVTIFVATAYLDEADRCHRVGLIHKGRLLACDKPVALRRLAGGSVLELVTPDARAAAQMLRQERPGLAVALFGDRLHLTSDAPERTDREVRELFRQAGMELQALERVEPSLEDCFVAMIGEADGQQEPEPAALAPSDPSPVKVAGEPAVSVRGLTRRFGDFTAVDAIDLEVAQGEIFGFLGPNGAGKSTTIRMLCGILEPSAGEGRVAGCDVMRQPEQIKTRIGYMSQKFSLYEDLTVEENIAFYGGIYRIPPKKLARRAEWVIAMAGLEERRRSKAGELSGGWKQRLALGCAMLHEPPVIFLDEPTSGVDPISRRSFWDLINRLAANGVTVFVTTHYMDEAEYCDRLGMIYRGELVALGSPSELKRGHMAEEVLEAACERPQDLLEELERLPGVRHAALFGRGAHVVTEDGAATETALAASPLAGQVRLRRVLPSLEDVFVSLIEARDRDEGASRLQRGGP
ncbi:ABC transporter ATP-binding protein [Oryzomonas sagensis]|uniref:ABC transporter ATP-binding protein n=2 Tax=Oryzomonas sagensis TaxID=2603857 RepID=A0ABQ6TQW2_9BACT|nr:ABC transporter ATP-binding protein [Oryzomonas sagensis]